MRRIVIPVLAALAAVASFFAPLYADDLKVGVEGVRFLYSIIPTGADLSLTYTGLSLSGAGGTELFLKAGGGYQDSVLRRDPVTGDPSLLATNGGEGFGFNSPNFQWELAFIQGLARRPDGANLVEAFVYYRGRLDFYPNEAYTDAVFSDMYGLFGTSAMGGISYDSVVVNRHRAKRGVYAEASAEWGPGAVNALSDFWRVSGQARGFVPVFDVPTDGGNRLNAYAGAFAGVDYAAGDSVPIYVNQSFGGRSLRDSLGDCVRGYGWNAYDSSLKAVVNAEFRLVGPKIWLDSIVPYLFVFADAGYYAGFADSANLSDASGFLASSGMGVAIDLVGFAQASLIGGVKLIDDELYGPADALFWGLKFFLHF